MNKSISKKFYIFSFIMTCSMVLYHTKINTPSNYLNIIDNFSYKKINVILDIFGSIAMCYFFTTTGFFLYIRKSNFMNKITKRIKTLLAPYLIWNLIYFLFYIKSENYSITEIILKFIFDPFDGPLWYIFAIFILSLFSPIIFQILKNKRRSLIFYVIVLAFSSYFSAINGDLITNSFEFGYYFERIIRYLPSYFLGAIIAIHYVNLLKNDNNKVQIIFIFIFLLSLLVIIVINNRIVNWFINIIQPIFIWFFIPDNSKLLKNPKNKIMNCSFLIYALHSLILDIINIIGINFSFYATPPFGFNSLILRFFIMFIVIFISFFTYIILNKLFPKLLMFLTGNR